MTEIKKTEVLNDVQNSNKPNPNNIEEDETPVNRSSNKKVTNSFTENNKQQNNFLQKTAILKHLVKRIVKIREKKVLDSSRSIRENYQKKVKETNKFHSVINNGIIGMVKDKARKSSTHNNTKNKTYFQKKPTSV